MKNKVTAFAESATAELARRLDIELDYINAAGEKIIIAPEVIRTVLATMGYRVENEHEAQQVVKRLDIEASSRRIPPVLVVRQDLQPLRIPVNLENDHNHRWKVLCEDGKIVEEGTVRRSAGSSLGHGDNPSSETSEVALTVQMPCGYHRLEVDDSSMSLIVVPDKCWLDPIERAQKLWGIAAQLYLLRSERNWGIGDFTDLNALIDIAAGWGASLVGLNPLHALFVDDPEQASPYAPASRLYLNILNIDVTAIREFATCQEANAMLSEHFAPALGAVRSEKMLNYRHAADLKLEMLRLTHAHFTRSASPERRRALEAFVQHEGESLNRFCTFQAIRLDLARKNCIANDWQQWPEELRAPNSPGIYAFAESHREDIDFFIWTQWIADTQLNDAARRTEAHQMAVGLYRDLAVGSSAAGAETWANPQLVVAGAHAGAPPDLLNPAGQDWGLPPFNPRTLRESGYTSFIELVRANMRYCGALRIDHVVGLQHLYWVPAGHKPDQGAYVTYPFDELAGILALESRRNHCLVIGEDLGTVSRGFSEKLNDYGILSYRVLYFEQNSESKQFIPPDQYRPFALATVGNHDLATLKGWWLANDIAIREQHGLYPDPLEADRQRRIRDNEKRHLLDALLLEGLDPGDGDDFSSLSLAVHKFLARCGAAIAMVQLDNLTGEVSQTNLPATFREYPNWRRRLSKSLENLKKDPNIANIIEAVRSERPPF
jgi:4-alpha-glucanotransferase